MKRGPFTPIEQASRFPGTVVDLDPEASERRILTPEEAVHDFKMPARRTFTLAGRDDESSDLFNRTAKAQLSQVCIRPKEVTLRFGRFGTIKLWPEQYIGQGRVWKKADGSIELKGVSQLVRVRPSWGLRIAWRIVGAPLFYLREGWLYLRGHRDRMQVKGAITS